MDDRNNQEHQPEHAEGSPEDAGAPAEGTADPLEDREPQEEHRERADTVDGALSPGSTATDSPTSRGEDD